MGTPIRLQTHDSNKQLKIKITHDHDYLSVDLYVTSGYFQGACNMCIREEELVNFIAALEQMYAALRGTAELYDCDSDAYLEFTMFRNGSMKVKGQVGASHHDHYMVFAFDTDQTVIPPFIQNLKSQGDTPKP